MSRKSGDEVAFLLWAGAILAIWLFAGVPFFDQVVQTKGTLQAYSLFLVVVMVSFGYAGERTLKAGLPVAMAAAALFMVADIISPPILIPFSGAVGLPPEAQLASDVFVYTLLTQVLHLPHQSAWVGTYLAVPVMLIFLIVKVYGVQKGRSKLLKSIG